MVAMPVPHAPLAVEGAPPHRTISNSCSDVTATPTSPSDDETPRAPPGDTNLRDAARDGAPDHSANSVPSSLDPTLLVYDDADPPACDGSR